MAGIFASQAGLTSEAGAEGAISNIGVTANGTMIRGDGTIHLTQKNSKLLNKAWARRSAQARTGLFRANLLVVGDSTSAGTSLRSQAWPTYLSKMLTDMGRESLDSSWFGLGGKTTMADWKVYDPRINYGAGWVAHTNTSAGGLFPNNPSTDTSALSFTPGKAFDTIEILYYRKTGFSTFTVDIGGAVLAGGTINSSGATAIQRATVSTGAAPAASTVNIKRSATGGDLIIFAVICYDSTNLCHNVWNAGWFGSTVGEWADASLPLSPLNMIGFIAPHLTIINLGINDWVAGTALATFKANLALIIDAAAASGDVILCSGFPSQTTLTPDATQQVYVEAIKQLALQYNLPYFSNRQLFGTWDEASASGFTSDSRHPNAPGHARVAAAMADFLATV